MFDGESDILLKMLRPQRMSSTSIICVKKDVDSVLEALNDFGEFHIEPTQQEEKSVAEYAQGIQKVQESLADANALTKQLVVEKSSPLAIFHAFKPTKIAITADNWQSLLESTSESIATLKQATDALNETISNLQEKTTELKHIRNMLTRMELVGLNPADFEKLKLIHVEVASVSTKNFAGLETALLGLPAYLNHWAITKENMFVFLAFPSKLHGDIDRILRTYHAEMFYIPSDMPQEVGAALKQVDGLLKENADKEKEISSALKKLGEENKDNLSSWTEIQENILTLLNAERRIVQSGKLATIRGFTPKTRFNELNTIVNKMLEGKVLVLKDGAPIDPNNIEKHIEPPTKIMNSRFIRPFEEITKLYGLPNYSEVDPTPFMAITFPILFGLMFGDLGHGLVLLIGGLTVGLLVKSNQSIKNICFIMAACGIATCITGILFGQFFGIELPWALIRPNEDVFTFLIFALFVGVVQICSGIVLEGVNYVIQHKIADALLTSLPKILFYIGGIYIIAVYQLDFAAWLGGPILAVIIPFIILVVGKPIYLAITKPKMHTTGEHAEMDKISGRLFEGGDFFTRLLSNTISYSRILALLMAHWALLLAVYSIAGLIGTGSILTTIVAGIVIVGGNVFVLALEGLIVFIHTLRLHFYEWFSKFYNGTGVEFHPFKQRFVHTNLTLKRKEKLN